MLQIIGGNVLRIDDYRLVWMEDGADELRFRVSIHDPAYRELREQMRLLETQHRQTYVVKSINSGTSTADIYCQLDLDDWKTRIHIFDADGVPSGYKSGLKTAQEILQGITPSGWTVGAPQPAKTSKCSIEMQGPTDLEVAMQMQTRFDCRLRFDTSAHTVRLVYPDDEPISNGYVVDTVNLRSAPYYKGSSEELYTRLYPIGEDGLTIASVNGGKCYLDADANSANSGKVVSALWKDTRYKDAQSLKDAAMRKLQIGAKPSRGWELDVVDLQAVDAERWPDMGLQLFKRLRLVDGCKGMSEIVQIVQVTEYPYYPERNSIKVSTAVGSATQSIRYLTRQLGSANSELWQKIGSVTNG